MIDLQRFDQGWVGLMYLADMILRLGSLPYLGYLIDRVATVASSPLPASSSIIS